MTADAASPRLAYVNTKHGRFQAVVGDLITEQLLEFGAHTRNELAMVLDHVAEGDVFVDLGAHIGTFAIPIARKLGPKGKLLAIEGSPETFGLLERNIGANGLAHRIQACRAVVGDDSHPILLRVEVPGNTGAGFYAVDAQGDCDALDARTLICAHGFARFDFLKIDVEGMEWFVLQALAPLIEDRRPKLYIEVVERQLARFGASVSDLDKFLRALDYRFFRNTGERNSTNDQYIKTELPSLDAGGSFFDLLALPS